MELRVGISKAVRQSKKRKYLSKNITVEVADEKYETVRQAVNKQFADWQISGWCRAR